MGSVFTKKASKEKCVFIRVPNTASGPYVAYYQLRPIRLSQHIEKEVWGLLVSVPGNISTKFADSLPTHLIA